LGLPARGINVGESPALKNEYKNLKTELWFKARQWLEARDCRLLDPDEKDKDGKPRWTEVERKALHALYSELVAVRAKPPESAGGFMVEKKSETKKRMGGRSPDYADAFILTMAAQSVVAQQGGWGSHWGKPMKRNAPRIR